VVKLGRWIIPVEFWWETPTPGPLGRLVRKFENVIKINVKEIVGGKRTKKETVEQA